MPTYSHEEAALIVSALELLGKRGFPVPPEVFDAWCGACITVPIELSVLRRNVVGEPEVLMIYRDDPFFTGWHIPGTIQLPRETEADALKRLIMREVGHTVTPPIFVARHHVMRGEENARGQEASSLMACFLMEEYRGKGTFFPLNNPPSEMLVHHKKILATIAFWWKNLR